MIIVVAALYIVRTFSIPLVYFKVDSNDDPTHPKSEHTMHALVDVRPARARLGRDWLTCFRHYPRKCPSCMLVSSLRHLQHNNIHALHAHNFRRQPGNPKRDDHNMIYIMWLIKYNNKNNTGNRVNNCVFSGLRQTNYIMYCIIDSVWFEVVSYRERFHVWPFLSRAALRSDLISEIRWTAITDDVSHAGCCCCFLFRCPPAQTVFLTPIVYL